MKAKHIFAYLLMAAVSVSSVACSTEKEKEEEPPTTVTPDKPDDDPAKPGEEQPGEQPGEEPADDVAPVITEVYEKMGLGWNLGNQFDAHVNGVSGETAWGNPQVTQTLFDSLKDAGFKTVRIPVTWMGHFSGAPDYMIEEAWLNRVAEVVGYAEKAGLTAIVNIHHDGADSKYWLDIKNAATNSAVNDEVKAKIKAIWTQVAQRFADKGDWLIFEGFNEIHDGGWGWGANRNDGGKQYAVMNEWNEVFVNAVRSAGGSNATRWLGVPAYCTNIDLGDHLRLPEDAAGRLMVSVHCYEPFDYTLAAKYPEWGHTGSASKKTASDEKTLVGEFDKAVKKWSAKGIPVYIGEFGCVHRASQRDEAFREYYLRYYCRAASDRRLPVIYWDNGASGAGEEMSGLFNRANGRYINNGEEIISAMQKAYYDQSPSLDDIYASAPK